VSLHLQIADTTIVNIYAQLVVLWPYRLPCTHGNNCRPTKVGHTTARLYIASQWDRYLVPQDVFLVILWKWKQTNRYHLSWL